jgi:hypothetical protein
MTGPITCGECLAFVLEQARYGQGRCHRYAPRPTEREDILFPKRLSSEIGCWEGIKGATKAAPLPTEAEPFDAAALVRTPASIEKIPAAAGDAFAEAKVPVGKKQTEQEW